MGTWSASVGGNDYFLDIEAFTVEICKINLYNYLENNSLLTTELFNEHLEEITNFAINRDEHEGPLALGVIILKNGGLLLNKTKQIILNEIDLELERYVYEDEGYKRKRHVYLKQFKNQIKNYNEGVKEKIYEESLIGLSFKRDFLLPLLEDLKQIKPPKKLKEFIEFLLMNLKTPLKVIIQNLGYSSNDDFLQFITELATFGELKMKKEKKKKIQEIGFGIMFFSQLFREHLEKKKSIKSFWVGNTNLQDLQNQPELGEEYGHYYLIYKLSLFGRPYIGQCFGSVNKRAAQHIAKFEVAPISSDFK